MQFTEKQNKKKKKNENNDIILSIHCGIVQEICFVKKK